MKNSILKLFENGGAYKSTALKKLEAVLSEQPPLRFVCVDLLRGSRCGMPVQSDIKSKLHFALIFGKKIALNRNKK